MILGNINMTIYMSIYNHILYIINIYIFKTLTNPSADKENVQQVEFSCITSGIVK